MRREAAAQGWNPAQYLKFAGPRLRPALDLLTRVQPAVAPTLVVDLGCGSGSVTELIARAWPEAEVIGVDASAEMLEQAPPSNRIRWERADLATFRAPAPAGLIVANAALHWLPDHGALLPALLARLVPGGVLAVQMPRNFDAPSHTAIADTVHAGPWADRLAPMLRPPPVAEPGWYADLLLPRVAALDIWQTEYLHVLEGADPVKEWTKGSWLAPFLHALAPKEAAQFEADYATRLRAAYPRGADGRTVFAFRRLFIVATAPG